MNFFRKLSPKGAIIFGLIALAFVFAFFFVERSQEVKVIRIARDASWRPIQLYGKEKNMTAFSNELLFAIAKEEGFRIQIIPANFGTLFVGLDKGNYDAVISSLCPGPISRQTYDFSDTYYFLGPVLIISKSYRSNSTKESKDRGVGFKAGSSPPSISNKHDKFHFIPYDNIQVALEDLANNKIDTVILDVLPAHIYTEGMYKASERIVTAPLNNEGLRLITKKSPEADQLIKLFNEGLQKMISNGTYEAMIKKWDLVDTREVEKPDVKVDLDLTPYCQIKIN